MRPIELHLHVKPITWIQYSREGDLLFVASKDQHASVWYTDNGKMLGEFKHSGSVTCIDVNKTGTRAITSSTDGEISIWNTKNGKKMFSYKDGIVFGCVQFSEDNSSFLAVARRTYGRQPALAFFKVPEGVLEDDDYEQDREIKPYMLIKHEVPISCAIWGANDKTVVMGCEDGSICLLDTAEGEIVNEEKPHTEAVMRIATNKSKTMFVTASSDKSAKLFDFDFNEYKTYTSTQPLNTAAFSPTKHHIIVGGGTKAQDVTTSSAKSSTFDVFFHHMIFSDEIGKIKGHFGPIHMVMFSPDGKGFASGGEDGLVKIYKFDEDYLKMQDNL